MISSIIFLLSFILPPQVEVESYYASTSLKFRIKAYEETIGTVHQKKFSNSYEFADASRNLQSVAILHSSSSYGRTFHITDEEGGFLGSIEESLTSWLPEYQILSPKKEILVVAETNLWNTNIIVYEPQTHLVLAEFSRPFFRSAGDWSAAIFCPDQIDGRILIPLLAILSE